MKPSSLLLVGMCLTGCMSNSSLKYSAMAEDNVYRLSRVQVGMGEREVIQIMHKPYSFQSLTLGEDIYDVWFYVTKRTVLDQTRMVPQNLTPLTFKNGQLVGVGYDYYNYLSKEVNKPATPSPATKQKPAQEDLNIEKALQNKPTQPTAPAKEENPGLEKALETPSNKPLSMAKPVTPPPEQEPSTDPKKKKEPLDPEGEQVIDDESDQNFNFW